jgi:outer membrane protein assembly factor BamB
MTRRNPPTVLLAAVLLLAPAALAALPSAEALRKATEIDAGLAVVVGSTDGVLEAELAKAGGMIVHGLALDDAACGKARATLLAQGAQGLATAEVWAGVSLPYARNHVNLVVVDSDALDAKAPAAAEIERVLAPGGVAYIRQNGAWQKTVKTWPKEMDDWTHWAYGPEGNAVSHDKLVKPSTSLKWIAGVRGQDIRVARGMLFAPLNKRLDRNAKQTGEMIGRDAFNGVPRWRGATGVCSGDRPTQWAASGGLVFHFPTHTPCYAVATDARTGQTVREYSKGVQRPLPEQMKMGRDVGVPVLLVCGKALVQGYGRQVVALDIATGDLLWRHETQHEIGNMCATPDAGQVFVHEVSDWECGRARWGKHVTMAVTCLKDGKPAWRNETLKGEELADFVYHDGALYAFDPCTNLRDDGNGDLFKLSAADGSQMWAVAKMKGDYNRWWNSILVRDKTIFSWGPFNNLRSYDTATGAETILTINGYNQRCTRLSATDDWLVFGLTSWVDAQMDWTQMAVGRSDCSFPAFLAHGQTFFTFNITCTCINPLRGVVALAPEEPVTEVSGEKRLQTLAAPAATVPAVPKERPAGVIAAEWRPDPLVFYLLDEKTAPVKHEDLSLVADVDRHALTATRGEAAVWTFVTGGRIYGAPVVAGGRCYVASADGWLYCLDAATGVPQWRFLAAPCERKVVAYGQVENVWPIYNVVVHDGAVCVAAGRHAELDGGIWLWGLDPATGKPRWNARLHTAPAKYAKGTKAAKGDRNTVREVASRTPLNGGLAVEDGALKLRSPLLNAAGSRATKIGYFQKEREQGGAPNVAALAIKPAEWHGKTVNPQELIELPQKKK